MKQIKVNPNNEQYYSKEFIRGFNLGAERQYEADIADMPTWIPCSERLPSNDDDVVLATTDVDGDRVVLMLAVDVKRFYLKGYVSAWMPSPKPWKGADDDI